MKLNDGILKEIDEGLRETVRILNDKNYITFMCCEGHPGRTKKGWISFSYNYPLIEMEIPFFCQVDSRNHLVWDVDEENSKHLMEIEEWARKLPVRVKENHPFYYIMGVNKRTGNTRILYGGNVEPNWEEEIKKRRKYFKDFNCGENWDRY